MKVIGINGSPRKNGNTSILFRTIFEQLKQEGIDTELFQITDYHVKGCIACYGCMDRKDRRCVINDDSFNDLLARMIAADGIILGSPVYSAGITSQMKAFIDRAALVLAANKEAGLLHHKPAAAIVSVRRGGGISAFDELVHFLHTKEVYLVGSTYWNMVYGRDIGEVENDSEGLQNMKNLGQNMAWLLKRIQNN